MFDFENKKLKGGNEEQDSVLDINSKYENGYSRVITENGAIKISILPELFSTKEYELHPDYQRRITWDNKKKSKLIESLIINIPIPPIFLYEYEFGMYEIMDGLQRVNAIKEFYENKYKLIGLEEWKELEGKKYKDLPDKIKEGIGRRQIQTITLLKESAGSYERADKIKRLLFERLNTGGVKLQPQEIRNALFNGRGNSLCIELSENVYFKKMWDIPTNEEINEVDSMPENDIEIEKVEDPKLKSKLEKHVLYKRMYDVELVLRYFSMRQINQFDSQLSVFLDDNLVLLNNYTKEEIDILRKEFSKRITLVYKIFGEYAFKMYSNNKWSSPTRTIYDPLMIAINDFDSNYCDNLNENIIKLKEMYEEHINDNVNDFDGKKQSKDNILDRVKIFKELLEKIKCKD